MHIKLGSKKLSDDTLEPVAQLVLHSLHPLQVVAQVRGQGLTTTLEHSQPTDNGDNLIILFLFYK